MAILLDETGTLDQVIQDLSEITGGEGGLGLGESGVPLLQLVRYEFDPPGPGVFGAVRINQLVNIISCSIVIHGGGPTDMPLGQMLCASIGQTGHLSEGGLIHVAYETTQCNGAGHSVFDASGNSISAPNSTILFHELSHAYHKCIGDHPLPGPTAEFQAITDENGLRAHLGLPLRDPMNTLGEGCECGMRRGLELKDVQIRHAGHHAGAAGAERPEIDIDVTIVNPTRAKTYHVMTCARGVRYDPVKRILFVSMSTPPATPELAGWDIHMHAPPIATVGPGETKVIYFTLPRVLRTWILAGLETRFEEIDISGVEHVECTVAHSETPFYPVPSEAGEQMNERLSSWGKNIAGTFNRSLRDT